MLCFRLCLWLYYWNQKTQIGIQSRKHLCPISQFSPLLLVILLRIWTEVGWEVVHRKVLNLEMIPWFDFQGLNLEFSCWFVQWWSLALALRQLRLLDQVFHLIPSYKDPSKSFLTHEESRVKLLLYNATSLHPQYASPYTNPNPWAS